MPLSELGFLGLCGGFLGLRDSRWVSWSSMRGVVFLGVGKLRF